MTIRLSLLLITSALSFSSLLTSCKNTEQGSAKDLLKINGSTTVNLAVAEGAEVLRAQEGMNIHVDTQGGSSGGISSVGEGLVQIGMSSKELTDKDRKAFPSCDFHAISIGQDAVALIVSKDVWAGGVKSISRAEMKGIYEAKITNWKELGGPESTDRLL